MPCLSAMTTASKTTTKTELMIDPTPTFYLTTETAKLAAHQCGTKRRRRAARQKRSTMISEPFAPLSPTAAAAAAAVAAPWTAAF